MAARTAHHRRRHKSAAQHKAPARSKRGKRADPVARRWSAAVTHNSNALDLDSGVFSLSSGKAIARSLLRSAERSRRRKSSPYRSAMSMLTFYVNRAGKNLSASRRRTLEAAKNELRRHRNAAS